MAVLGTLGRAPVELIGQVAGVPGGPVVPGGPFAKPPGSVTLLALAPGEEWVVGESAVAVTAQYATDPAGPWAPLSADNVTIALDGSGVKRSAGVPLLAGAKGDIYLRAIAPDGTTLSASRSAYDTRGYSHARLVIDTTHAGAVSLVEVQFLDTVAPATPDVPPAPCEGDEGCAWSDPVYGVYSEDYSTYTDAAEFLALVEDGDDPRYGSYNGGDWTLTDGSPGSTFNCKPVVRSTRGQAWGWWVYFDSPYSTNLAVRVAVKFDAGWTQPNLASGSGNQLLVLARFAFESETSEFSSAGLGLAGDGLYLFTHVKGGDYQFTKVAPMSALVTGSWREFRLKARVTQESESVGLLHTRAEWGAPCVLDNTAYAPTRFVQPDSVIGGLNTFNHTYDSWSWEDHAHSYEVGPWRVVPGLWIGEL